MSLWSRDRLRIALAPGELALVRHQGNPAQPQASKSLSCEARDAQSLMPLLERELADPAWQASKVDVVLSSHFVRYVLTPPPGKALSQEEEAALVNASFREIYGTEISHWRVRVQSQPPQSGLIGAAMDESLALQLEEIFKRLNRTDWSVHPLASIAAHSKAFRPADWWVLAEPGWLSLFNALDGHWHYLSGQPAGEDWRNDLPDILDRETRMAGTAPTDKPRTALIQSVGIAHGAPPATPGWAWRIAPHGNARGALALATA